MNTEKLKTLSEVDLREEEYVNEILEFIKKFIWCGDGIAPEEVMNFARCVIDLANERFKAIVAAMQREECAKIADEVAGDCWIGDADWDAANRIAALIRARGKV